jgi:hypothetical protein
MSLPVNTIRLLEDEPQSSIKWTTSPKRRDGCPVNTIHGVLNSVLKESKLIPGKCLRRPPRTSDACGKGSINEGLINQKNQQIIN